MSFTQAGAVKTPVPLQEQARILPRYNLQDCSLFNVN
jgi:hypothetical protein